MLKPVNYKELENHLKKITNTILASQEQQQIENQQDYILSNLLSGHVYSSIDFSPRILQLLDSLKQFRVCAFQFDDNQEHDIFRIHNLAKFCESIIQFNHYISVKASGLHYVLIIVGRMSTQTQELQSLMKQLQDRIYQFFHTTVSVGISNLHSNYEALHTAYTESLRALGKQFFTGNQCIHFFLDQNSEDELGYTDYHTLYLYQKKIETSIATYQGVYLHQQASSLFYEWVSVFNKNVSLIKSSFIVLSVLSINSIIGSDKQQTALLFEKYANFQKVIRCDTLEMLKDIFVNMIIDLSDFRSIKNSTKQDIVNKITDYISNHYMEQLSLSTVAKSVFLSPSYLSSLITGETGKNFTDIVNEIRISKSIELLKNPKMRIADIAYSVGFNEPQYFSSIFKKCTNLTPRDYRDFYLSSVTERK